MPKEVIDDFHGPESLIEAAETLLTEEYVQAVVVRGLHDVASAVYEHRTDEAARVKALYGALHQGEKLDEVAQTFWEDHGLSERTLVPHLQSTAYKKPGAYSIPHCDISEVDEEMPSVLSMSLGLSEHGAAFASWRVLRQADVYRNKDDNTLLTEKYLFLDEFVDERYAPMLRPSFLQGTGDLVIFSQLPRPTAHAVHPFQARESVVFEYITVPAVADLTQIEAG